MDKAYFEKRLQTTSRIVRHLSNLCHRFCRQPLRKTGKVRIHIILRYVRQTNRILVGKNMGDCGQLYLGLQGREREVGWVYV